MGPKRMCIIEGCPNYSLETKDTCAGHVGAHVAGPAPTAPSSPSRAAMDAAKELLLVPTEMARVAELLRQAADKMLWIETKMNEVIFEFEKRKGERQTPQVFFLNEAHETHITKSQARRERDAAKKELLRAAEGKAVRRRRAVKRARASGSRRR